MELRERIRKICEALEKGLAIQGETVRVALIAALAGKGIFLLGPQSDAKRELARALSRVFSNGTLFTYILGRTSTVEEIFGDGAAPGGMSLTSSDVAFLDGMWNAPGAVLNALISFLDREPSGENEQNKVRTKVVVGASSDTPPGGADYSALWNRFTLRLVVEPSHDEESFVALLLGRRKEVQIPEELPFDEEEIRHLRSEAKEVTLSEPVMEALRRLRSNWGEPGPMYVSDGRWRAVGDMLRMAALLDGRNEVVLTDLVLLRHILWNQPDQRNMLENLLGTAIEKTVGDGDAGDFRDRAADLEWNVTEGLYSFEVTAAKRPVPYRGWLMFKPARNAKGRRYQIPSRMWNSIQTGKVVDVRIVDGENHGLFSPHVLEDEENPFRKECVEEGWSVLPVVAGQSGNGRLEKVDYFKARLTVEDGKSFVIRSISSEEVLYMKRRTRKVDRAKVEELQERLEALRKEGQELLETHEHFHDLVDGMREDPPFYLTDAWVIKMMERGMGGSRDTIRTVLEQLDDIEKMLGMVNSASSEGKEGE